MNNLLHLKQFNKATLILILLGIGAGLLVTSQWKTKYTRVSNPVISYVALEGTRDDLLNQQSELIKSISFKKAEINQKEDLLKNYSTNKNDLILSDQYKKELGLTEIKDMGLIITIDDSPKKLANSDSIAHAADLRDLVNFLWSVGANAIGINGERVVFSTSIDCIVNTILINTTKTTPPFKINVTGDAKFLEKQLNNGNNLKDIKKRVKIEGLIFNVSSFQEVTIPAYKGSFSAEYAKTS